MLIQVQHCLRLVGVRQRELQNKVCQCSSESLVTSSFIYANIVERSRAWMHKLRSYIIACTAHKFHLTQSQCLTSRNPTAFRCKWTTNIKVESSSSTEVSVPVVYISIHDAPYDMISITKPVAQRFFTLSLAANETSCRARCVTWLVVSLTVASWFRSIHVGTLGRCGYKHNAVSVWEFSIWFSSGYLRSHAVFP